MTLTAAGKYSKRNAMTCKLLVVPSQELVGLSFPLTVQQIAFHCNPEAIRRPPVFRLRP